MAFHLSNKKCLLTYKTHLPKEQLLEAFQEKWAMKFIRAAHENADEEHPYEHTHLLFEMEKKPQISNPRAFDIGELHPHIKKVLTVLHWRNAIHYLAKEDPENADLLTAPVTLAEKVWDCKTVQEAMMLCGQFGDASGALALYNARPAEEFKCEIPEELRQWQVELLELLAAPPGRSIIWIVDETGGAGKSTMAAILEDHYGFLALTQMGAQYHTGQVIKGALDSGWRNGNVVVDLTRQARDRDVYDPIEAIKNGRMTTLKYQGKAMRWRPGHVVVFSNFPPYAGKWSADRYGNTWSIGDPAGPLGRLNINDLPPAATAWPYT